MHCEPVSGKSLESGNLQKGLEAHSFRKVDFLRFYRQKSEYQKTAHQ